MPWHAWHQHFLGMHVRQLQWGDAKCKRFLRAQPKFEIPEG